MLHKAPLFTTLHRPAVGGLCGDPTRPWEEMVNDVTLPECERLCQQLVSFPRLDGASTRYVRACGRAIRKVLLATVPHASAERSAMARTPELAHA
jgi:hypothetical protein